MSNIYIQEPPTHGKVLLETTVGDIDIELWSKEAPKACRNFIQLLMEGYYNGTGFHRVVKGFIVQGGDPEGDGTGGESIYGKPFKDEFHTRLRFCRRGLLAMANAGKDDNGSQFFFTMAPTPELQSKHTIFGKVAGDTIYNMLKLEEVEIGEDERPVYPPKIIRGKILFNPFEDIVPRVTASKKPKEEGKKKGKVVGKKDFKLLSFGAEAEEDEEEMAEVNKSFSGKSKSSHDLANDPKLSSQPAVESNKGKKRKEEKLESDESDDNNSSDTSEKVEEKKKALEQVKKKLKKEDKKAESSDDEEYYLGKDRDEANKIKMEEIRKEIRSLKKEMKGGDPNEAQQSGPSGTQSKTSLLEAYQKEMAIYREKTEVIKKGTDREKQTLGILEKFKTRLKTAQNEDADEEEGEAEEDLDDFTGDKWLAHKLKCEDDEKAASVAKDANMKGDDWFDIYDPRNNLNKRRVENSKEVMRRKRYQ